MQRQENFVGLGQIPTIIAVVLHIAHEATKFGGALVQLAEAPLLFSLTTIL